MKRWRFVPLIFMFAVVLVAILLPNTGLAWLRGHFHWLGQTMNWIEFLWPAVDTTHVLIFVVLGGITRLSFPSAIAINPLGIRLTVFAALSEVLQYWAPGREPRLSDFALDVMEAWIGLLLATAMISLWRALIRRKAL